MGRAGPCVGAAAGAQGGRRAGSRTARLWGAEKHSGGRKSHFRSSGPASSVEWPQSHPCPHPHPHLISFRFPFLSQSPSLLPFPFPFLFPSPSPSPFSSLIAILTPPPFHPILSHPILTPSSSPPPFPFPPLFPPPPPSSFPSHPHPLSLQELPEDTGQSPAGLHLGSSPGAAHFPKSLPINYSCSTRGTLAHTITQGLQPPHQPGTDGDSERHGDVQSRVTPGEGSYCRVPR